MGGKSPEEPILSLKERRRRNGEDIVVAKRTLAHFLQKRAGRRLAVWGLVIVQAQLLWVSEFHGHGEDLVCQSPAVLVREAQNPSPGAAHRPVCLACRIARETTAQPATGIVAATSDSVIQFCSVCSGPHFDPLPLSVVPARAPPVL